MGRFIEGIFKNTKVDNLKPTPISPIDFYQKINRYVVHNVKNSTKNLSALVTQLQDEYTFSDEYNELLAISLLNFTQYFKRI